MAILSKLLKIWVLGSRTTNTTPLLISLLLGVAAVTVFSIFSAIFIAVFVGAVLFALYNQLLIAGLTAAAAGSIIALILLALIGGSFMIIKKKVFSISAVLSVILSAQISPISSRVNGLADAFMSGFNKQN